MFRLLLKKYLLESALLWLACAVMVFAFCWTRVWIVTRFELHRFEAFLDQLRQFEQFMPVPLEQVLTYAGSLALTFDEPVLMLCVLVWSISRGSDVVSGELGRGTLEMLLAQPVSRLGILLAHGLISLLGLAGICTLAWLGLAAGIHTNSVRETIPNVLSIPLPFWNLTIPVTAGEAQTVWVPLAERVSPSLFILPTLNLFTLGLFVFALSVLCSAWDRFRWRTIGCVIGFYVLQFLLFLLAKATPETEWFYNFTFFTLYQPDGIVNAISADPAAAWQWWREPSRYWPTNLGPLGVCAALTFLGGVAYTSAAWIFHRRDLPAPA
jgi:ABC-2 type transport system permease protein